MTTSPEPGASGAAPVVLVVEDEPQVMRFLRAILPSHGYSVLEATTGNQAIVEASTRGPDLVLLDLGLPDLDGIEVTRRLREWSAVPIIVVSARGEERDKIEALDAGADDYLTKPFGFAELLARMRVALRRAAQAGSGAEPSVIECGPLKIDLEKRRVDLNGNPVHLTPIEYKLLTVLAKNAGKVVTHGHLLTEVWGPKTAGEAQSMRVHMTHLRRKLEPDPARARIFRNEAGVGYRLECPEREDRP